MDLDYARQYSDFEQHHWWFRARRVILRSLLAREISWRNDMDVLEIGVGPGQNLYTLYPPGIRLAGLEPDEANAEIARRRGPVPVYTGTIEKLPPPIDTKTFDVITMFDVLEHIEDDRGALDILKRKLKPGGRLVLAVPTYMWMWGQQDVVSHHYRRYTLGGLKARLRSSGFRVVRATYFNSLLFPPVALFRLLARMRPAQEQATHSDFDYSAGPLNHLLYGVFASEALWLRIVNFPFGVSAFVVAALQTDSRP